MKASSVKNQSTVHTLSQNSYSDNSYHAEDNLQHEMEAVMNRYSAEGYAPVNPSALKLEGSFNQPASAGLFAPSMQTEYYAGYQQMIVPEGAQVYIPHGYIQIEREKQCSRRTKVVTNCEHFDRKHYAKGLCSTCYHKEGRTKLAWDCEHTDRVHYAKGCCQDCYLLYHSTRRRKQKRELAAKQAELCGIAKLEQLKAPSTEDLL
uniref:Uncharacterized protein n=1 Tax=Euplotes harpa TaxID=151035 RepID=A0A7S3J2X6_9SPIT|mmetsp:Transcript_1701/g.2126  ORF Transcript_1701/g.2126 Transcript_1701/m.2126 type:complete len:205 (+) Transcript_1701:139-753(+)